MKLLEGRTIPEVWLKAASYVNDCHRHEDLNVFLHVREPTVLEVADRDVWLAMDQFFSDHGAYSIHTVAETIFPLDCYEKGGAAGVYEDYPRRIKEIHAARTDRGWGTYAHRLVRQKDRDGTLYNPLSDLVAKMKNYSKYVASFELGVGPAIEEEICIYDGAIDRRPHYGGPCLSHLSFKSHKGAVHLNATYRSHYYIRRLFGNMVGLGRLLYFISVETGLAIGSLTINSTYAKADSGNGGQCGGRWTQKDLDRLLADCSKIYSDAQEREEMMT
ncbi:hypothetical protein MTR62_13530 [Novosphingobium sp. 1949]|uniref:Thymidylate synthase n=1 Tax=Novosphingobium organovorum TaxID=2930092 RepID=A0ABT0BF71_9SPHN|nr:hypothetical protein [Novosphingobium organovorum]MCJ2183703.1 hypothetical protein [Novosphingobium organovorum]